MDFEEFLWAMGNDTLMDFIQKSYNDKTPLGQAMHRKVMDYFKEYLIVGGMPQAVKTYSETRDFEKVDEEIYKKILFDKLSFNEGMIIENIVAQMLVSGKRKLYFYSRNDRKDSSEKMEIDFLIAKNNVTSKHNITPIEVKSGKNYTYSSLNKFKAKYKDYLNKSIIIHQDDLKQENEVLYLPIYMTSLL